MVTKTISITVDAYERLRSWKIDNESFSDVITRITSKRKLSEIAGILTEEEGKALERAIRKGRESSNKRMGGAIFGDLKSKGIAIDTEDCMIAGIAKDKREKILTKNTRHFHRIEGLEVESY